MFRKALAVTIALILVLAIPALAAANNDLYDKWNNAVRQDLWGDYYKTELYPQEMAYELDRSQSPALAKINSVSLGELGMDYGKSSISAVAWIKAIANGIALEWEPDSVICYLAEQVLDADKTCFVDSQLTTWTSYGFTILEELYSLKIHTSSGGTYEIMVLLVSEGGEYDFVESVLVSHSGNGLDRCPNAAPANADDGDMDLPPLYVVNCKEWISVWSEPRSGSFRLDTLPLGTRIDNWYPYNDEFILFDMGGDAGFVSWDYLSTSR